MDTWCRNAAWVDSDMIDVTDSCSLAVKSLAAVFLLPAVCVAEICPAKPWHTSPGFSSNSAISVVQTGPADPCKPVFASAYGDGALPAANPVVMPSTNSQSDSSGRWSGYSIAGVALITPGVIFGIGGFVITTVSLGTYKGDWGDPGALWRGEGADAPLAFGAIDFAIAGALLIPGVLLLQKGLRVESEERTQLTAPVSGARIIFTGNVVALGLGF